MFRRCLLILLVSAFVAACETPDTIGGVTFRAYDSGFQRMVLTAGGTFAGEKTEIFLRRLQNGGKLEICGFYLMSDGISQDLTAEWLKYAKFTINDEEIVSSKFLRPQTSLKGATANCVVTTTVYSAGLATGEMSMKGRSIRLIY